MKLEQENEAEINQVAVAAGCEGYAVVCDNKAVNFANVEQDNDAEQANANNQYSGMVAVVVVTHKKQN